MAKKKSELEDSLAATLADSINKQFKGQNYKSAFFLDGDEDAPTNVNEWVSTGCSMLDLAISNRPNGGFPVGRITEITGLEASGKSLLAAHTLAETQKKGGLAVYIDTESASSAEFLTAIGVDLKTMLYVPLETIEEIYIEEIAKEEINIGTVNVFKEIPMEVTYGNQETIEEISAEVEVPEERVEVEQTQNNETRVEGSESTEEIASEPEENQPVERNTNIAQGSETNTGASSSETETVAREEPRETNTETDRDTGVTEEIVSEDNVRENVPDVSVADIQRQIENRVTNVNQILVATNQAVANIMSQGKSLDTYSNKNQNIFNNQLNIDGGNYYDQREYVDTRNIYAETQNEYSDPVAKHQANVQKAMDEVIRSEIHLRRIRGY